MNELVAQFLFAENFAVYKNNSRVEEVVARNADDLLAVVAENFDLLHNLFVTRADVIVAEVGVVKFRYIGADNGVAVNIYRLFVLRKHIGDKETEIGRFSVVMAYREFIRD